jgi:hypothetical protein
VSLCVTKKTTRANNFEVLSIGAGLQARMLGGSVDVAVVNSVWLNCVRHELESTLSGTEMHL